MSKFFDLRVDPFFGGLHLQEKQTGSQKFDPLCEMAKKHGCAPLHLKILFFTQRRR